MTGLGSAARSRDDAVVRVEVRSVNHRWLKLNLKLPRDLAALEPVIEARTQQALRRGAVAMTIVCTRTQTPPSSLLDRQALAAWQRELAGAAEELALKHRELALGDLLALPGVLSSTDAAANTVVAEALQALVLETVDASLADLLRAREEEGRALVDVLLRELDAALLHLASVRARAAAVPAAARERLLQRLRDLVTGLPEGSRPDERELAREVLFTADRGDITEELDRFDGHAQRMRTLLANGGEAGRKLDFLLQEMLREANTIGSKSQDAALTHEVVELKCRIERMKEQVQNLE